MTKQSLLRQKQGVFDRYTFSNKPALKINYHVSSVLFLLSQRLFNFIRQLKKIISILLIAVFFTAQYARQLAYLECKLAVLTTAEIVNCDCEKQTDIDKIADDGIPASKSHTHISVDEFFSYPATEAINPMLFHCWKSRQPSIKELN